MNATTVAVDLAKNVFEVAAADGKVSPEESRLLEMIRFRLNIGRLAAAASASRISTLRQQVPISCESASCPCSPGRPS